MAVTSSTTSVDQDKYLASKLLEIAELRLVAGALCDKDIMPRGAGLTAYMVRYKRMRIPLTALTEGTPPTASTLEPEQVTVTLDQWGDFIEITDVAELTTKHPLMVQAQEVLADNAARLMDREIQLVMLAGTTVTYGTGVATRASVTSAMVISDLILLQQKAAMGRAGVPAWQKRSQGAKNAPASGNLQAGGKYLLVAGPEVVADIIRSSTFISYAAYGNGRALLNAEVGEWHGFRIVETNFIPQYKLLGNTTATVLDNAAFGTDTPTLQIEATGGSLTAATVYYFKVTRKDLLEGFEEDISIEHSATSGAGVGVNSFQFQFTGLTAGYVYNLYFGASTGDANLKLHTANIEVGTTVTVQAVSSSTSTPPTSLSTSTAPTSVHVVYLLGNQALGWTGFYNAQFMRVTGATKSDPLNQKRTIGFKFMGKAVIKDQTRIRRLELASNIG